MQLLPGMLSCLALIFFVEEPKNTSATHIETPTDFVRRPINDRAFLDPIDYSLGKKSCSDGYVHGIDHFILTGFINVTGYTLPKVKVLICVMFLIYDPPMFYPIITSYLNLWNKLCTDVQEVPLDKCSCKYESNITIRVKCNITAHIWHSTKPFLLNFITDDYSFGPHRNMTTVYNNTSCKMEEEAPKLDEFTREHARKRPKISDRAFLDPINNRFGKKSCRDGYVHGMDHFILTGYINVTDYTLPKIWADFMIMYYWSYNSTLWQPINSTCFDLWEERCTDIQEVPLDKCRCKYEWPFTIRVKCNLTAYIWHSRKPFLLNFVTDVQSYSAHRFMTKVYHNPFCGAFETKSGGTRLHGGYNERPDHIFLATALVCTVTSMFSNGQ